MIGGTVIYHLCQQFSSDFMLSCVQATRADSERSKAASPSFSSSRLFESNPKVEARETGSHQQEV